jgi:ribonuclease Z
LKLTFLGTGNFQVPPGRYWNSFVVDGHVLVEPAPTALPHLRRCGIDAADIDTVLISHFHPDHTFGWPFLLLEMKYCGRGNRPLHVVGPPGVQSFLAEMMELGGVPDVHAHVHDLVDVRYHEVDLSWQNAGRVRFRAVQVEHVPHLECFGYIIERGDRVLGYSGDTRLCAGLEEIAAASEVLVLECNGVHPWPTHMDVDSVRTLRERHPDVRFVLTHVGEGVSADGIPETVLPDDFETLEV